MRHNYVHANVNDALPVLLHDLLALGDEVGSRAGRTKELMHVGITLADPLRREILVKHRKPNLAAQIAESVWVLAGKNDIGWLEHYLPRAKEFSDDGLTWRAGYGPRLRDWTVDNPEGTHVDQLAYVINTLRESPASRQVVMSIWDPTVDTTPGKDIPCNNWLSWSSRLGKLDLHVAIRSNDVIWGWSGINQFEWSVLLEVVAGILGLQVGQLHFSVTSFHIYDRHWDKAQKIVEASGPTQWWNGLNLSPRFDISGCKDNSVEQLDALLADWLVLEKQIRHGHMSERQVDSFREPMLQSWLRVLQWWWSGEVEYLAPLEGTALETAARDYSVQPPERERTVIMADDHPVATVFSPVESFRSDFIDHITALHDEKHAAYGPSWKARGELLSIMANIARKIDRLGKDETRDEISADTAGDLFVYLAKYRVWLDEQVEGPIFLNWGGTDTTIAANEVMAETEERAERSGYTYPSPSREFVEEWLTNSFERLWDAVQRQDKLRTEIVNEMLIESYRLARATWQSETNEYAGADSD